MKQLITLALTVSLAFGQQMQINRPQPDVPLFKAEANLVIVTAFVRTKDGKPLPNLKKEDFRLFENGKPQQISVFEYEELSNEVLPPVNITVTNDEQPGAVTQPEAAPEQPAPSRPYRDRRLMVLFFDMSSMSPPDQYRAERAAERFLLTQMTSSDMVAIMSYGTRLNLDQDFTDDRTLLLASLQKFRIGEGSDRADVNNPDTDTDTSDNAEYTADDTEFNIFNTDSKLSALESAASRLTSMPEKKAFIYFSAGVGRTGMENQSQLSATVNAAVRANVSFYPVDVRGLDATPPGGDASIGPTRGSGLYSGSTQRGQRDTLQNQQDTLTELAGDTGGKALLDVNDLTVGIQQAQKDLQSYYVLGYYSTDPTRDGKFRSLEVKLADDRNAKIDFRNGYFAPKEFQHFNAAEKEHQLEDALLSGDPVTDIPLALEVNYFRLGNNRYFVPLALKIPGSVIPLKKKGGAETTQLDFIGEIRDDKNAQIATVRDAITIKLRDEAAGQLAGRSLVYDTGFVLGAGKFKVKMLARENQTGQMGTFETDFIIPTKPDNPRLLATSSVVLGSQRDLIKESVGTASKRLLKGQEKHPLVDGDRKLIPSVTNVFREDQTLYAYLEAYDPRPDAATRKPSVAAVLSFIRDGKLVYESKPITVDAGREDRKTAIPLSMELPLKSLKPGPYTLQVTVIDQPGERFATPRERIYILPPAKAVPPVQTAPPQTGASQP